MRPLPTPGGGIDLSYNTLRDRRDALNKFEDLVARNRAPRLSHAGDHRRVPPPSRDDQSTGVFECYRGATGDLGFDVGSEHTGCCANSGFAANVGATMLCGTGPVDGSCSRVGRIYRARYARPARAGGGADRVRLSRRMAPVQTQGKSSDWHAPCVPEEERSAPHVSGGTLSAYSQRGRKYDDRTN